MIVYVSNLREGAIKLLELISKFSKYIGYEGNYKESVLFLYISNEHVESKI